MGLVKTRRLARHSLRSACSRPYGLRTPARGGYAMQKQQRAKAGMKPPVKKGVCALPPHLYKSGGKSAARLLCCR